MQRDHRVNAPQAPELVSLGQIVNSANCWVEDIVIINMLVSAWYALCCYSLALQQYADTVLERPAALLHGLRELN